MGEERAWYRYQFFEHTITAPLTAERAAALRARGVELEPAGPPEDLAERLAPFYRLILGDELQAAGR